MPLLFRGRRPLAIFLLLAFALPALLLPFVPRQSVSRTENRVLAAAPDWPHGFAGWSHLPRQIDAYAADHFALRERLVRLGNRIRKQLGGGSGRRLAVEGRSGWLFLSDGLLQSTGQITDPAQSDDFAAYVCQTDARLKARGVQTLFTLAPSPGEIYPEFVPTWAGPAKRPTNYDRVLAGVRACGVAALDLRPVLIGQKARGPLYRRTDSHWTLLGASLGYNAMVEALGKPQWRMALDPAGWRTEELRNGDLTGMARLEPRPERVHVPPVFDRAVDLVRQPIGVPYFARPPFFVQTGRDGPTVLMLGDSFTENPMTALFGVQAGRFAWVHQDECGFDWAAIDIVKPDIVIIAPAEREARCTRGRPLHMPAPSGSNTSS